MANKACGTCVGKENEIKSRINELPEGTSILRAEYSEISEAELAKYGVVKYDSFTVFDADGNFETIRGASVDDVAGKLSGESKATAEAGVFAPYSDELIGSKDTVILSFSATWCPACVGLKKDIEASQEDIPAGVAILHVDYDTNKNLREKYGVSGQHTQVIVDAQGNEVKKWRGGSSLEDILAQI